MAALLALVEHSLTFIHGAHLHRVESQLGVLTVGAWFLHLGTTHGRIHHRNTRRGVLRRVVALDLDLHSGARRGSEFFYTGRECEGT